MSGEIEWDLRWWRYWSDGEDSYNDSYNEEEERNWREARVWKKIRIFKSMHEKALNEVNLAQQEAQNLPKNTENEQTSAFEEKIEAKRIVATKAEEKLLKYAKSKNIEPYSGKS
jgi:hypothetical protein